MKIYDLTELYPYRPSFMFWLPEAIAAAGSLLSTVLTNRANKNNAKEGYDMQKDYSNWLLRNQTQESVQDLRAAGLNPAFMNGSQLANTPSQPQYDVPNVQSPFDFSTSLMLGQAIANARKANADAEAQELLNEDKKEKNKVLAHQYDESVWMVDGKPISDEEATRLLNSPDGKLPDFVIRPYPSKGSEGRMQGEQVVQRWKREVSDINLSMVQNQLNEMVSKGQIQNPEVLASLENMPYRAYKEIIAKTDNLVKESVKMSAESENLGKQGAILDTQKLITDLEYQIMQDSNLYQYVNKAFDGNATFKDALKAIAMAFVGVIQRITLGFTGKF